MNERAINEQAMNDSMSIDNRGNSGNSGDNAAMVDAAHPWLGLASFTEATRAYFYGREEEVAELARRVQRKLLTVLFGQSGLGKTSILRAGLVPRLREQGILPVYVRIDYSADAPPPASQIKEAVLRETAAAGTWTHAGVAADGESLWEFFHHRDDVLRDAAGKLLTPLLIFDQFEEVFTLAQSDDAGRARAARFLDALAELAENRPSAELEARLDEDDSAALRFDFARNDYRILITLREDYLAHLESLKTAMPSITQNRMRLAPMTGQQALAAVRRPGGHLVSEEVAEAVVRFVAGGAELAHAQVEPSLLSLICRELNDKRVAAGRDAISLDLLAGSHAGILGDFYERALADQPQAVRVAIEDLLLTSSGYRDNVAEERVLEVLGSALSADAGLPADHLAAARRVLALLVNRRLLRIEDRLDIRRVELTHDVLCGVVQQSRALREEREKQAEAERALAVQRERELATRRALTRARRTVAVCAVLTVVAVAGSAVGYISMRRAQETQALSERSRAEAESLMSYLLDDFYGELLPVGRVGMLDGLTRRTLAYYDGLPAAARSDVTNSNRARALLLSANVNAQLGNRTLGRQRVDEAIAILQPIIDRGSASEQQKLSYAQAIFTRGSNAATDTNFELAKTLMKQGAAMARPLATVPNASMAARLAYASMQSRLGWAYMRSNEFDLARATLLAGRAVLGTPQERATNIPMATAYNRTNQWLHELLARFDVKDYAGAEQLAQETLAGTAAILRQQPNHRQAADIQHSIELIQAEYALAQRENGRALEIANRGIDMQEAALHADPASIGSADALAIDLGRAEIALIRMGKIGDALAADEREAVLYKHRDPSSYQSNNLLSNAQVIGEINAELEDRVPFERLLARMNRLNAIAVQSTPAATGQAIALDFAGRQLSLRVIAGDPAANAASAGALIEQGKRMLAGATDNFAREMINNALFNGYQAASRLAYADGNFQKAALASASAFALTKSFYPTEPDLAPVLIEHALNLARTQSLDEARTILAPELATLRAAMAKGSDDQFLRLDLAKALLVTALLEPARARQRLQEALALLDSMAAPLQRYRSVKLWRQHIEGELRTPAKLALR